MEPAITLTNYLPCLGRGITVLLSQLEQHRGSEPHPDLALFTNQVTQALTQFVEALENPIPLQPLPELNETMQDILTHLQERQEERLTEIANQQHHYPSISTRLQYCCDGTSGIGFSD